MSDDDSLGPASPYTRDRIREGHPSYTGNPGRPWRTRTIPTESDSDDDADLGMGVGRIPPAATAGTTAYRHAFGDDPSAQPYQPPTLPDSLPPTLNPPDNPLTGLQTLAEAERRRQAATVKYLSDPVIAMLRDVAAKANVPISDPQFDIQTIYAQDLQERQLQDTAQLASDVRTAVRESLAGAQQAGVVAIETLERSLPDRTRDLERAHSWMARPEVSGFLITHPAIQSAVTTAMSKLLANCPKVYGGLDPSDMARAPTEICSKFTDAAAAEIARLRTRNSQRNATQAAIALNEQMYRDAYNFLCSQVVRQTFTTLRLKGVRSVFDRPIPAQDDMFIEIDYDRVFGQRL